MDPWFLLLAFCCIWVVILLLVITIYDEIDRRKK